jgi:hypothetical protein
VNATLIAFNGAGGAFGIGFETCASCLMVAEAGARGDAGGLQCHASGLHPQHNVKSEETKCCNPINHGLCGGLVGHSTVRT